MRLSCHGCRALRRATDVACDHFGARGGGGAGLPEPALKGPLDFDDVAIIPGEESSAYRRGPGDALEGIDPDAARGSALTQGSVHDDSEGHGFVSARQVDLGHARKAAA